jgi:hypothetical protein
MSDSKKGTAVYHAVKRHEDFETAAQMLFELTREAAQRFPGKPRHLFLDIDGHRNSEGGFDHDMLELQQQFLMEFIGPYYSEVHAPLVNFKNSMI